MALSRISSSSYSPLAAPIAIVLVVSIGAYLNVLYNGVVYDDKFFILRNPWITDLRYLPEIFTNHVWAFKGEEATNYYRPMLHVFYLFDSLIFGIEPWSFHLTKVLFHAGSSVAVFLIVREILESFPSPGAGASLSITKTNSITKSKTFIPLGAALLFAAHPVHNESVTVGTSEVMFAFFYLFSYYLFIRARGAGRTFSAGSLVLFFLSALSKETALTLPILLVVHDYITRDASPPRPPQPLCVMLKKYIPYAAVALVYLALRTYAIGGFAPLKRHAELGAYEYLINVFPLFGAYLWKLLVPVKLSAVYVFHPITSVFTWKALAGLFATAGFASALYLTRSRNKVVFTALVWIVVPLLPALYIPALGDHTFAERYLYLPSVGFVILAAMAISSVGRYALMPSGAARPVVIALLVSITCLYSFATIKRNPVWKDDLTLWSDTVERAPDSHMAHMNLGNSLFVLGRLREAGRSYATAITLNPGYAMAHYNLGNVYFNEGRFDEARSKYMDALEFDPSNVDALTNLGLVHAMTGRTDEAIDSYMRAIGLAPGSFRPRLYLANLYLNTGRPDEAIREYERALRAGPGDAEAMAGLGMAYANKGDLDRAIEELRGVVERSPGFSDAHYYLGTVYVKKGMTRLAAREFERALEIDPDDKRTRAALLRLR